MTPHDTASIPARSRTARGAALVACLSLLAAADWPQFRGPARDGVSAETGFAKTWPASGPPELWRRPLGDGYSGITVAGDRLFTMFASGDKELAVALDAATGQEAWRREVGRPFDSEYFGPRSTPAHDEGLVFVLGSRAQLYALSAADGSVAWHVDLPEVYGAKLPQWGAASSPLVEGDRVIVDVGGRSGASVVAFDKKTGSEVWRTGNDKAGYSAPIAITVAGKRQIVCLTGTKLAGFAAADGAPLWQVAWETSYDVNAATPIHVPPDKIFVSTGYDVGAALYKLAPDGERFVAERVWASRELRNRFSSSVHHGGYIYGFDEKNLKCVHARTGQVAWSERDLGHGSLFWADGHLIALGDAGTLVILEATPQAYTERARAQVFEGRTWTVPTLAGGRLYLRDLKQIVALDVSG
jgi:outer membrane protein assembly factor BamB